MWDHSCKRLRSSSQEYNKKGQPAILTFPLCFRQRLSAPRQWGMGAQEGCGEILQVEESNIYAVRPAEKIKNSSTFKRVSQSLRRRIASEMRTQKRERERERNEKRKFTPQNCFSNHHYKALSSSEKARGKPIPFTIKPQPSKQTGTLITRAQDLGLMCKWEGQTCITNSESEAAWGSGPQGQLCCCTCLLSERQASPGLHRRTLQMRWRSAYSENRDALRTGVNGNYFI